MTASIPQRQVLLTVLDIPVTYTAQSWQFVVPKLVIGVLLALVLRPEDPVITRIGWGLIYGILLLTALLLHIGGHMLASKLVSPAMTQAFITPALIQTLYQDDTPATPGRVHLIRSLGGPLMNIVLTLIAGLAWLATGDHVAQAFAWTNLVLTLVILLPLPTIDGEVIWREIGRLRRQRHD